MMMRAVRVTWSVVVALTVACGTPGPGEPREPAGGSGAEEAGTPDGTPGPALEPPPGEVCLVDRGCAETPTPLARCEGGREDTPLAEVLDAVRAGTLEEGTRTFSGVLRGRTGECLAVETGSRCGVACNYFPVVALPEGTADDVLQLLDASGSEAAYSCTGDATLICCSVPTGETPVRVKGRVVWGGRFRAAVWAEEICVP